MNGEKCNIKKIIVQISRAQNLLVNNEKKKKPNKWRVMITGGKKKYMTELVGCADGQPYWNSQVEMKLARGQHDPVVLLVVDMANNQYGQVLIPLATISPSVSSSIESRLSLSTLQCTELEPSRKCTNPSGNLLYRISLTEYYPDDVDNPPVNFHKRTSIFGFKVDQKPQRKQSYVESSSQLALNYYDSQKLPKRLSLFKSNEKPKLHEGRSKAKSLANIHVIEDLDHSMSSESDSQKPYIPSDDVYDQVTRNHGWVRVGDMANSNGILNHEDSYSIPDMEGEKVDLFSVQPDNGPITGNFTVVMEGSNFTSGLFDLTYVCIDGLEPIDATTCTKILSDTELLLSMPPVSIPGMVNIYLELLDGSRISCTKTFHYIDSTLDPTRCGVLTPTMFDHNDEDNSTIEKPFDQYDDVVPSPISGYKQFRSEININKNENATDTFHRYDRRKLSDYGSQGSFRSDRTSSLRKKMKKINSTKYELYEEVENLRKEVSDLKLQVREIESSNTVQIVTLQCQLGSRENEIDDISRILCNLKMQLLEDGLTKYLELL